MSEEALERLTRVEEGLSAMEKSLEGLRGDMVVFRGTLGMAWPNTRDLTPCSMKRFDV